MPRTSKRLPAIGWADKRDSGCWISGSFGTAEAGREVITCDMAWRVNREKKKKKEKRSPKKRRETESSLQALSWRGDALTRRRLAEAMAGGAWTIGRR